MGALVNVLQSLPISILQQAVIHSANSLVIYDAQQPDLPIVYANPSFESLTGYTAQEVLGKSYLFLQGQNTQQAGIENIRQAVATGIGCKVLLQSYHKDGRPFWNEITLSPLVNESDKVTHYVSTQIDISHYLETFRALQESESRYRHLYEKTPAMLHSIDSQGCIVSVSDDWLAKLGYQNEEVIGQPLSTFLSKASQQQISSLVPALSSKVSYRDQSCQFIKKNGDRIDALLSTIIQCDDNGCSCNALGVLVDITERKRAQENLRRSEALLRAINNLPPTGIFVMDCHTNEALFVNSQFYRIWQLEHLKEAVVRHEITGEQLLTECLSNIDLGAFVATSTARDFTDGNKIVEDEVPLLDGRTLRRIYGPIQENNSTFAYLYIFEDITERKQAIQKLAQATADAEAANLAKSEFLANMSHELRSPLNAILGFTHILKESQPTQEQQESLDIIYNSGEHLLALINDVLDISKIEAGRITLSESEFDLYRLLDELQQMFHNAACAKGLQLEVGRSPDLPHIIYSDRLKLRQILINLLSNAVKFTATGTISLTASTAPQAAADRSRELTSQTAPQTLAFAVTDTGSGISLADQHRLFEAFVQTESGLTAQEGTGLGLTISQEYAQILGGTLTVESKLNSGSTFTCNISAIPVSASLALSDRPENHGKGRVIGLAPNQPPYKILIADDVALNRKLLKHLLYNAGFEVKEATNGQETVNLWRTWQPHLIWLDMRMPVMNGEEAALKITALDTAKRTKLIALTASAFDENKITALNSGCHDFVSKPIRANNIFEKMAQHLGVRYQYEPTTHTPRPQQIAPLTPEILAKQLAQAPPAWQHTLTQAVLDLDDVAILNLTHQLPIEQSQLAQTIATYVKNLAYKQLLQALQSAEAVKP
ncbi:MAG: PAS domain S-box protein [Phormidesmis sp.]